MSALGGPGAVVSSAAGESTGNAANISVSASARKPSPKWTRTLSALLRRPMTSFDLEEAAADHCAPTTISQLRRRGLEIHATLIEVPGYAGQPARVARYELAASSRDHARQLINKAGVSRAAP